MRRLSVSSWPTRRARLAPSDARIANSLFRASASLPIAQPHTEGDRPRGRGCRFERLKASAKIAGAWGSVCSFPNAFSRAMEDESGWKTRLAGQHFLFQPARSERTDRAQQLRLENGLFAAIPVFSVTGAGWGRRACCDLETGEPDQAAIRSRAFTRRDRNSIATLSTD
jgi:hypothetical protein